MALDGSPAQQDKNNAPIWFSDWRRVLETRDLPPVVQARFRREITWFLRYCGEQHAPASVTLAKRYLDSLDKTRADSARDALRWFVRNARMRVKGSNSIVPVRSG